MPQLNIYSSNIDVFEFSAVFNPYNKTIVFNTSATTYSDISGSGQLYVPAISFQLIDQDGVEVMSFDFSSPPINPSLGQSTYTLDLSSLSLPFFFQTWKITGGILDSTGAIYYTTPVYKKVCQPVGITESGYVPGLFQIAANCPDNILTVKELTVLVYDNKTPDSTTKTGTLSYPTGTISPVSFTGTPFTNDVIYTGQYRVACTTVSNYDLGDEIFVAVTYLTNNVFEVTCASKMSDIICCIVDLQTTAIKQCNNAIGKNAQQQLAEITLPFLVGLSKEINGQDSSEQALLIKKMLKCNCGVNGLTQNEFTPINPSVTNIVLSGVGGTTVPAATTTGNTKTYQIASNTYQIVKGNTGDLAFTITIDTSTQYTVKYKITFNYEVMASYILNAIEDSPSLLNQLNTLVTGSANINLNGLDGACVIDMDRADYSLTMTGLSGSTVVTGIVINGTLYNAPSNLFVTDTVGVATWLNSLTLGTFSVIYNTGTFTVLSVNNENKISTLTVESPDRTGLFQSTNKTLVQVLQAIVDYLCGLTALQVALNNNLALCYFDYNGDVYQVSYPEGVPQGNYNAGVASAICNIVARINTLTGVTCTAISAIFQDYPNRAFTGASRAYGSDQGDCVSWTDQQLALGVINAIQNYSDVKSAFCAIDCTLPNVCPDITDISLNMAGNNIGIYGVTWAQTPLSTQTVTVRYKLNSSSTWIVATNALLILPNGNVQNNPPYLILNPTAGETYDIQLINNCGGTGFIKQITTPTGTVYSGSYLIDSIIYNICGNSPVTLYSSQPFASGVVIYTNIGLTVPLTGYNYIASNNDGAIFEINSSTGVVGLDTGSACSNGTGGTYILGNNTGTICSSVAQTLYTNGSFAIGGTIYTDSALSSPVTGSSYVVNASNNHIYNLNSLTGQITSDTGLTCGSYSSSFGLSVLEGDICAAGAGTLYSAIPFTPGATMFTDSGLNTLVTGYNFILDNNTLLYYSINPVTGVVGAQVGECFP